MSKKTRVFLLAHGLGTRWDANIYPQWPVKHLAEIGGEPIIGRTIRQCKALGLDDILIVGPVATFEHLGVLVVELLKTGPHACHGMADTAYLWHGQDRIIVIQADVVCSWKLLETMLADTAPTRIYGRIHPNPVTGKHSSERSVVHFEGTDEMRGRMLTCVRQAIAQKTFPASFRGLMEAMLFEFGQDVLATIPGDFTDDIDSVEEWEDYGPAMEAAIWAEYDERGYL